MPSSHQRRHPRKGPRFRASTVGVMADTFGDHMSAGSGKRPAPTIEGTATEVTVDPAPDETASPDPAVEAAAPDAEASKPKRPKGPPPRTSPTELKSFVTHLAAGLLGGLIGVVGVARCLEHDSARRDEGAGPRPRSRAAWPSSKPRRRLLATPRRSGRWMRGSRHWKSARWRRRPMSPSSPLA